MNINSRSIFSQSSNVDFLDHTNSGLAFEHLDMLHLACGFCGRTFSGDVQVNSSPETFNLCGDCKFLLLEDLGNQVHDSHHRRVHRGRRLTYGSFELIEGRSSQEFLQMINLARRIDHQHEDIPGDDTNLRSHQSASSRTTPSGSRRWRRLVSDTDSDGFYSDSIYGESESNVSFGAYRVSYRDGESVSFSTDGGDSDATVDDHTLFDRDMFVQSVERSDFDSDSDIDPMHAGAAQWDSDDHEADDYEWEDVDAEEHTAGSPETGTHSQTNGQGGPSNTRTANYPEFEEISGWSIRQSRQIGIPSIFTSMEEFDNAPYLGNPGDYLESRAFDEFLEHLAETDSSRRGAPPASASFINSLPLIVVLEEHQTPDGLVCAICKDLLATGTEANQLPCHHLYHPSCILPWLKARNSCPLCRYELPTDDIEYEQGKLNALGPSHNRSHSRMVITEVQQHDGADDSSSVVSDASELNQAQESGELSENVEDATFTNDERRRWLFIAAAPLVSLVGIVVVLWLGNPLSGERRLIGQPNLYGQRAQHICTSESGVHNQRVRRWWWF